MHPQQFFLSQEDRAYVGKQLGHKKGDVDIAASVLSVLHAGQAPGKAPVYSIDVNHATYFVVRVRHLRTVTNTETEQLLLLTSRVFEVTVDFDKQKVSVFVFKEGRGTGQDRAAFTEYEPPGERKVRKCDINWQAGKVFDADDQRHLGDLIDDVYNYENCMPDVRMFYEHISGDTGQAKTRFPNAPPGVSLAAADDDSSEGSLTTSEQAVVKAKDACGFAVCFLGMPECKIGTFSKFLRRKYGPVISLVYASFGPPSVNPDASMLVVHVRKTTLPNGGANEKRMLSAKAPLPPKRKKVKRH